MKQIESKMQDIVELSAIAGVTNDELVEMFSSYMEGKYE